MLDTHHGISDVYAMRLLFVFSGGSGLCRGEQPAIYGDFSQDCHECERYFPCHCQEATEEHASAAESWTAGE